MHEEGVYPICGNTNIYLGEGFEKDEVFYVEAKCQRCGFAGHETFIKRFDGFVDIYGNPVAEKEIL